MDPPLIASGLSPFSMVPTGNTIQDSRHHTKKFYMALVFPLNPPHTSALAFPGIAENSLSQGEETVGRECYTRRAGEGSPLASGFGRTLPRPGSRVLPLLSQPRVCGLSFPFLTASPSLRGAVAQPPLNYSMYTLTQPPFIIHLLHAGTLLGTEDTRVRRHEI